MSKFYAIFLLMLGFLSSTGQSNDGVKYIQEYLKQNSQITLNQNDTVCCIFLYCSGCNSCTQHISTLNLFALLKKYKSIVVFDKDHALSESIRRKANATIVIDKEYKLWKYGLEGIEHRYFVISKGQIIKKGLLDDNL